MNTKDKEYVLILGASSDLGCEIIRSLQDRRASVIAHYNRSWDKIKALTNECREIEIIPIQADLADQEMTRSFIDDLDARNLNITQVIHLPGSRSAHIRFKDLTWESLRTEMDIQVRSLMLVLKAVLPRMVERGGGKIVVVLSGYTMNVPPRYLSGYITAKFALWGLTRALAIEYAGKNININAVSPSMVETSFLSAIPRHVVEMAAEQNPMKRNATPKDIAPVVHFLLSRGSDFMTGLNIPVSGGSVF